MTDLEKAARMALDALEYYQHRKIKWDYSDDAAITAIREALAEQPAQQQEPVGQLMEEAYGRGQVLWFHKPNDLSMLYTSPPASKPWVGLTEEERKRAIQFNNAHEALAVVIEAKLKEKNNGTR